MIRAVTYQYNGCSPRAGGSGFREYSKDFGTKEPFEVRVVFDGGSFLDGH